MPARSGVQYLDGLRDGRCVLLDGRPVADVTAHPALAGGARSVARLYDLQHEPATREVMVEQPGCFPRSYGHARSRDELLARGRAFEAAARATGGLMGRSPDFLATVLAAWAAAGDFFARREPRFGRNIVAYHASARERDLCHTHAISDPPGDRYLVRSDPKRPRLAVRAVRETADGIVVRGAKMLATLAPLADELLVYPFQPLSAGEEDLALCFAIPIATSGLRLHCRPGYATGAATDWPLSHHFDEMDAVCVFDDVLVPWERVFMHGDVAMANALRPETGMTSYAWYQAGVRASVKARLVYGVAAAVAEVSGKSDTPSIQEKLGELAVLCEALDALLLAAEAGAAPDRFGNWVPAVRSLGAQAALNITAYPRLVELLQLVGGSGLVMHPADADLEGEAAGDLEAYFEGRGRSARGHVALLRLAAELATNTFGGRQTLYERFYLGAPEVFRATFFRSYADPRPAIELVDAMLGELERG